MIKDNGNRYAIACLGGNLSSLWRSEFEEVYANDDAEKELKTQLFKTIMEKDKKVKI